MAGSFSGHLVDSFLQSQAQVQQQARAFGQPLPLPLAVHGAMSFAPSMHGSMAFPSGSTQASFLGDTSSFMDMSEDSARRIATLQAKLDKKLGPEYISQRPGPGGGPKLTYAEGWKIINLANEVFGFNGWSSNVVSLTTDFVDHNEQTQRYSVGVTAIVRITLRDGVYHEDIGYGLLENAKSKGAALDKCKKEAVTDAVKRALRNFGNLLGNCLYDKSYAQEVVKIKVPPPKFDKSELHRRPEFEERKPDASPIVTSNTNTNVNPPPGPASDAAGPSGTTSRHDATRKANIPQQEVPRKPLSSIPPHVRGASTVNPPSNSSARSPLGLVEHSTPVRTNDMAPSKLGLNTPVHTPAHPQSRSRPLENSGSTFKQPAPPKSKEPMSSSTITDRNAASLQDKLEPTVPAPLERTSTDVAEQAASETGSFEEYGMYSQDDALFASIDLGDGDIGIGGHIDFDEGSGGVEIDIPETDEPSRLLSESLPRPARSESTKVQPQSKPSEDSNRRVSSNSSATSSSNAANRGPPRTSSMGSFHFPPGVSIQTFKHVQQPTPVVTGSKRSADAMLGSSGRRPIQGMGLSHQPMAAPGQKREPLAPLDVGEGGDVKRARR
ncbi:hypothetical protein BDW22DRAFT_1342656 [Trametopsis cervina]|nr:hypothetical protein BDW22DRAFT_1342656 [Trametopsis cervina]